MDCPEEKIRGIIQVSDEVDRKKTRVHSEEKFGDIFWVMVQDMVEGILILDILTPPPLHVGHMQM